MMRVDFLILGKARCDSVAEVEDQVFACGQTSATNLSDRSSKRTVPARCCVCDKALKAWMFNLPF
jgi:hypothetical protein